MEKILTRKDLTQNFRLTFTQKISPKKKTFSHSIRIFASVVLLEPPIGDN